MCTAADHACEVSATLNSNPYLALRTLALADRLSKHIALHPEVTFVLGLSILLPLIRWVLQGCLYKPIASRILQGPSARAREQKRQDRRRQKGHGEQQRGQEQQAGQGAVPRRKSDRVLKMCESFWKLTCYGSMLALEVAITHREPWFWRPSEYWVGWPDQPELPLMRLLFYAQLAYYISTTFTLALWEVPRSDYWVMQTHHCCTVVLIYYNYISGYQRWGCLIMLLHDVNDVIMEVAKCLNYADCQAAANAAFGLFVAAWAGLRLYAFPAYLIKSTLVDSVRVLGYTPPHHALLNTLLCTLVCFHIYWFGLILRVAYMTLTKGKAEDIREKED